ncbi:hypothetical protein P154DRAFT_516761 [Amniculicola lignicola CBS 123094]|uniref:Prion-inhibition and propagation HeLo domain-containing protein n=1 Tax=Amniculicola lignicola CBS 123094 TaxID=1392246 RepID=A0A6A5X533_9PLEO|nr:hypothetical protein P154DRAFT_516761 [Amniculicola lignicola CBS 123094]
MDIAANTLQTLGFAGQIFTGAINGFSAYQTSSDLGRDAIELQIKLEWTRSRLDMWGTLWGLSSNAHLDSPRFKQFGMMALNHLVYINYCLDEFKTMDDLFPTLGEAGKYASTPAVSLARLGKSAEVSDVEMQALRYKLQRLQKDAGVREKALWALKDGRAMKMVETVKAMVEDLYAQFPPPEGDEGAESMLKNAYLTSERLDDLDVVAESKGVDPKLASLCALKAENLRVGAEKRSEKLLRTHDPYKIGGHVVESRLVNKDVEGRWLGTFRQDGVSYGTPVLVEYKTIAGLVMATSNVDIRIQNVARLLSMANKPVELRTLNCIGVTISRNKETVYRFIHELKYRNVWTLSDLFKTPTKENLAGLHRDKWPLEHKFALATALAKAVLHFHLAGWLHKGIRSTNIVFNFDDVDDIDLAEPYIIGFEYSRPAELGASFTETVINTNDTDDCYRHPDTQGPPTERRSFARMFDIYSLGMVLLDIGSKRSIANLRAKYLARPQTMGGWTAEGFRKWLLDEAIGGDITGLAARMGGIYTEVVRCCLSGKWKGSYKADINVSFYMEVLRPLQQCNV